MNKSTLFTWLDSMGYSVDKLDNGSGILWIATNRNTNALYACLNLKHLYNLACALYAKSIFGGLVIKDSRLGYVRVSTEEYEKSIPD